MKRRIIFGVLALLWLGFIFFNSLQNAEISGGMSEGLLDALGLPEVVEGPVRKITHFCFFAVLGILVSGVFCTDWRLPVVSVLLTVLLCACVDETLQLFSAGRSSELRDVWIDFGGATLGMMLSALFCRLRSRKQKITIEK